MGRTQVEQIKERLDIVEVVRSYLGELKRSGANYFALCPFHNEKTPSFSVNSDLGIFKCFGCGESGDVITFIEKMEGVDFLKALEIAAKRAGIQLESKFSKKDEQVYKEKQLLLKINSLVADYYNYILLKHKLGKKGLDYAKNRKLTRKQIDIFKIGYAPNAYTNLIQFLTKKGFKLFDLIRWGFAVKRDGKVYDKFRNRLIFPLIDHRGDIVGFSGRTILKNTKAPKYLHSPQTVVFDKSSFLFGLGQAKMEIRKMKFVVICEGQLDVISSHKTNVKNIVASLGTSLTPRQFEILKRYTDNVYFCFDNDLAGETALIRATLMAQKLGLKTKAITISQGKDADEMINTNKSSWEDAVIKAEPIIDHMIKRLSKRLDLMDTGDKEIFAKTMLLLIATLPSKIEQVDSIHKIAGMINVNDDVLYEEILSLKENKDDFESYVDVKNIKKFIESPANMKEEYLLSLLLQHSDFLVESLKSINVKYFSSPLSKQVLKKLKIHVKKKEIFSIKNFVRKLEKHEIQYIQNLLLKKLPYYFETDRDLISEIKSVQKYLRKNYLLKKIKKLKKQGCLWTDEFK